MAVMEIGMGIDFGTINLLIYLEGQGIIFNEPSVVAYDISTGDLIACGKDAYEMTGKVHDKIRIVRPLREGVISDIKAATDIIRYCFERVIHFSTKGLHCVICCPSEVTEIERDALVQIGTIMGAKSTRIEEEVKSGIIGAGEDIFSTGGKMVIDIGGGTTDIGVVALGEVVLSKSIRKAGSFIDGELIKMVKQRYKVELGPATAERAKMHLSTLNPNCDLIEMKIAGRDLLTGLPKNTIITNEDVRDVLIPIVDEIAQLTMNVLKDTPPEICSDISDEGILLNGGGAQIDYLPEYLEEMLGLDMRVAPNPLTSVVLGTKILLQVSGNTFVNHDF